MSEPNSRFNTYFCCFSLTSFDLPLHDAKVMLNPDHGYLTKVQTEKLFKMCIIHTAKNSKCMVNFEKEKDKCNVRNIKINVMFVILKPP